jgi:hypothetical protein
VSKLYRHDWFRAAGWLLPAAGGHVTGGKGAGERVPCSVTC